MPLVRPVGVALLLSLGAALMALSPVRPAAAQTPAIGFAPGATGAEDTAADVLQSSTGSFSLGFEFRANSPALLTALGFFNDPSFNPNSATFTQPHPVGLYQVVPGVNGNPETGLLLASATVTSAGTRNGFFLYQSLAVPLLLVTGNTYVLAGVTGPNDPFFFDVQDSNGNAALTVNPAITYLQDRSTVSSTLAFPGSTDPISEPGFFGPNFLSSPVPEASTSLSLGLLLMLGAGGLVAARRRKTEGKAAQ